MNTSSHASSTKQSAAQGILGRVQAFFKDRPSTAHTPIQTAMILTRELSGSDNR